MKPRLLDLFSGAGGAARGYQLAGFEVWGVDIAPQPRYCGERFQQMDALAYLDRYGWENFDAIHASPPCQALTTVNNRYRESGNALVDGHLNLIPETRELLQKTGLPYVIENVPSAHRHMQTTLLLNGSMFGLGVQRSRIFESNVLILAPLVRREVNSMIGVYGRKPDGRSLNPFTTQRAAESIEEAQEAMGIDWMNWRELCEAIPPAYTEFIGHQLLNYV